MSGRDRLADLGFHRHVRSLVVLAGARPRRLWSLSPGARSGAGSHRMEGQYKPEAMSQPSRTPSRGPLGPRIARPSRGRRRGPARAALLALACLAAAGCSSTGLPVLAPPEHGERVLVVAPHIDDEAIAAGGYAA